MSAIPKWSSGTSSERLAALEIVGLGGSIAALSRSRSALKMSLEGAESAGAVTRLLDLRALDLPMYNPEVAEVGEAASMLIECCYSADGLLWSSPMYQGTISGALKNALDWLHLLADRDPSFLHDKVIGLISTAGGTQARQAARQYDFTVERVRIYKPLQFAPLVVVRTNYPQRLSGDMGQIQRRLDPRSPSATDDRRGWAYEGFYFEVHDRKGVPAFAVFNYWRGARGGGGQWARSEALYPYPHG